MIKESFDKLNPLIWEYKAGTELVVIDDELNNSYILYSPKYKFSFHVDKSKLKNNFIETMEYYTKRINKVRQLLEELGNEK